MVPTKTFVPYEQYDLDIILNVPTAIYNLNLADLNCSTILPQASNQAVLGVFLVATVGSINMG